MPDKRHSKAFKSLTLYAVNNSCQSSLQRSRPAKNFQSDFFVNKLNTPLYISYPICSRKKRQVYYFNSPATPSLIPRAAARTFVGPNVGLQTPPHCLRMPALGWCRASAAFIYLEKPLIGLRAFGQGRAERVAMSCFPACPVTGAAFQRNLA